MAELDPKVVVDSALDALSKNRVAKKTQLWDGKSASRTVDTLLRQIDKVHVQAR